MAHSIFLSSDRKTAIVRGHYANPGGRKYWLVSQDTQTIVLRKKDNIFTYAVREWLPSGAARATLIFVGKDNAKPA